MVFRYNVPPEDIRASGFTFQALILSSFNRLHELIATAVQSKDKSTWENWFAVEMSVRCLDAFVGPYYDANYLNLVNTTILPRLTVSKLNGKDRDYLIACMDWVKLMVMRFGQVDVLPHIPIRHEFKNPVKYEEEGLEKYDTTMDTG